MITNSLQSKSYLSSEIIDRSPYLKYDLSFDGSGIYDLWGFGHVESGSLVWSFDDNKTNLPEIILGSTGDFRPQWTKFGSVYIQEGGLHSFTVYLKGNNPFIIEQWYFTTDRSLSNIFESDPERSLIPLPLSEGPFMTSIRIRSLSNGNIDDIVYPTATNPQNITCWQTSNIYASGLFNYEVRDNANNSGVTFENGLSLEFWQTGGSKNYFAAWEYSFNDSLNGKTLISKDHGKTFELEP